MEDRVAPPLKTSLVGETVTYDPCPPALEDGN